MQTKTKDKSVFIMVPKKNRENADVKYKASSLWDSTNNKDVDITKDRLVNLKDVELLGELLNIIYPKSNYQPTQLQQTNDDLIEMGSLIKYVERNHPKSKAALMLAYVMKEFRNSYKIFINEDCEAESFDSMDLHEKGHILFNHTQNIKGYIDQFRKELDLIWDTKLAKYFDGNVLTNNKDKVTKMLYTEFSNIAQDMEINSKLFDNGEWVKAKKTMARSGMIVHYKNLLSYFDDLSGFIKDSSRKQIDKKGYQEIAQKFLIIRDNIKSRINGEEGDFQFCYPANKGWPEKLDWMTYMILLIKDIDNTMQQIMNQLQIMGMKLGSDDGSGGQSKKISQEVLDDYFDQQGKEKDARSDANDDSLDEDDDEDEDDNDSSMGHGRSEGGNQRGRGTGAVKVDFETCDTFDNFTKFLRKNCLGKKNRKWNSDVLYNSNRRKFSGSVVVPRRHLMEKWMPTECHIIVDVSGSVPTDYVERVINSIVDTNSGIDLAHSHIIFCDERVTSDEIISKRTKSVYAGGGTAIYNAIKYVNKKGYCKKKTDKLFIISDFQDNLGQWVEEGEKLNCIKYAIGYNVHSNKECEDIFNHTHDRDMGNSEFKIRWNRCFKTVFITEEINQ